VIAIRNRSQTRGVRWLTIWDREYLLAGRLRVHEPERVPPTVGSLLGRPDMSTTRTYTLSVLPTPQNVEPAPLGGGRREGLMTAFAAVAMIAFAWSGFQSSEWVRARFLRSDVAAVLSEDALEISAEADRLEERDIILYVEWLVAVDAGAFETAEDVFLLFRPEVQQQVLESGFGTDETPPVPPFDDPGYDAFEMRSQANDLETESREQNAKSRDASRNAARYGGLGVMFAAVLAAVGIAGRFHGRRWRGTLFSLAAGVLVIGLLYLAFSPVNVSGF
jgi:hypothetical protein